MPVVNVETLVPATSAADVFARISDFPSFADHTDAVREITIGTGADGELVSDWSVNFRSGVLCWCERDRVDRAMRRVEFEQLHGDFAGFAGSWQVVQIGDDVSVSFAAEFDLGMPSLSAIVDPIAVEALRDNVQAIIRGLLGEEVVFFAGDEPEPVPVP